ncbi:MAG: hypothetical protein CVU56_24195 [Deltaproteobacteria bacterium HGW-Deltaproteobacteria-14]|jgi:hypothetical protein|nr:MAG: hypothetical protein CVU56_24195 [Deltaproteobacteria bacterium HGW-Deltaproteobacteria-14]
MKCGLFQRGIVGLAAAAIAAISALTPACDTPITLSNAVPRVNWVAVEPLSDTSARIIVWISDVEGDSVDLDVSWVDSGGVATPIAEQPGSYGTTGLPTREALFDPNGQPHEILWDTRDLAARGHLRMIPDDQPTEANKGTGTAVETPDFDLATGIPEPVRALLVP